MSVSPSPPEVGVCTSRRGEHAFLVHTAFGIRMGLVFAILTTSLVTNAYSQANTGAGQPARTNYKCRAAIVINANATAPRTSCFRSWHFSEVASGAGNVYFCA